MTSYKTQADPSDRGIIAREGGAKPTFPLWLAASALLLTYCLLRGETMLSVVQAVNIAAIVTTLLLVRRSNRVRPHHLKTAGVKQ